MSPVWQAEAMSMQHYLDTFFLDIRVQIWPLKRGKEKEYFIKATKWITILIAGYVKNIDLSWEWNPRNVWLFQMKEPFSERQHWVTGLHFSVGPCTHSLGFWFLPNKRDPLLFRSLFHAFLNYRSNLNQNPSSPSLFCLYNTFLDFCIIYIWPRIKSQPTTEPFLLLQLTHTHIP